MAWQPPADAIPWTPPVDAIPTTEGAPYDPAAIGMDVPADVRYEVVPPGPGEWLQALFPRSVRDTSGSMPMRIAGDVLSIPGRAYASLGAPESERFVDAMARTQASPQAGERGTLPFQGFSEALLRDPVNIPLAAVTAATGGLTAPAWLARLGWAGQGVARAAPAAATIAAGRQAGNLAAGRDVSAREVGVDLATGGLLGVGMGGLSAGMQRAGEAAVPAMMKLSKVATAYREGVREALPEMIRRGLLAPTVGGLERNMQRLGTIAKDKYAAATAGTEGVPAVSLRLAADDAAQALREQANRGRVLPEFESDVADWIRTVGARPSPVSSAAGAGMVDVPTAIASRSAARKAAGSYESQAPKSMRREAMQQAADDYAAAINARLSKVAPAVREADAYAMPYYQVRPLMDALGARSNNYEVGLTELGAGTVGGLLGNMISSGATVPGTVAMGALARLQRHPAFPYLLNRMGQAAGRPVQSVPMAQYLIGAPTDNARGR